MGWGGWVDSWGGKAVRKCEGEGGASGLDAGGVGGFDFVFAVFGEVAHVTAVIFEEHLAGAGGASDEVDFGDGGGGDDGGDLGFGDPAAGENGEAMSGLGDELGDGGDTREGVGSGAGGEDAVDAELGDVFEGFGEIAGHIEGAVEGDLERGSGVDESGGEIAIDRAVWEEGTEDDAIGAGIFGGMDIVEHGGEVIVIEEEVAPARADENHERAGEDFANGVNETDGRGGAAFGEIGAEFDAIGATEGGGVCGGWGIDGDFEWHEGVEDKKGERENKSVGWGGKES